MMHPAIVSVVLGDVTPAEIEANVADVKQPVPPALWRDLKSGGAGGSRMLSAGKFSVRVVLFQDSHRTPGGVLNVSEPLLASRKAS